MSGNKSIPQNNPKKKRPLSSPADLSEQKTKPVGEKETAGFTIPEEAETEAEAGTSAA